MRRWAEAKYKIPWTHEAFQQQTLLDLLTSFWEDHYADNPLEAKRTPSGEVTFQTGDPLLDKWEREIAEGYEPDLTEGLSDKDREKERRALEKRMKRQQKVEASKDLGDGFSENYG